MANQWTAIGDAYRRTITWAELEHFKQTGELPPVLPRRKRGSSRLPANQEADRRAAAAHRERQSPDPYRGLAVIARDPALADIYKQYYDMKTKKPDSLVLDLWLIKAMYDAGYALRADGGISLPLTSEFRRGIWRTFMEAVYAPVIRQAQRFLSRGKLVVPLFAKTLAGTERLLKDHKLIMGIIKKVGGPKELSGEAASHHIEEAIMDAADRYDPNYVSLRTGKPVKFTSWIGMAARKAHRFLRRDVLNNAESFDKPIQKSMDDTGKEQTLYDVYADTTAARDTERWKLAHKPEIATAAGLNENQRAVFDNWSMSGKALADKLGVSEPRVSQLRAETLQKVQDIKKT
jgi:hypothetical protein